MESFEPIPAVKAANHLLEVSYVIYLFISISLTIWVARTLQKRGRVFLVDVFKREDLADSVNHLLVVGFYLINFGYVSLALKVPFAPETISECIEILSRKVGMVLLILGGMHFFNIFLFNRMRKARSVVPPIAPQVSPQL